MHHAIRKNLLAHEVSPYLLQHQFNPVDWYPWGPTAFTKAQQENKPILLSIGYSACHWCHVMAHESFESEEIAEIMNQNFVNIKVDREERPDLDSYYQNALSLLGRSGGWPLTMFLNSEGKPFWGGTYFPPHRKYNLPGFKEVLNTISDSYKKNSHSIMSTANQIDQIIKNERIQTEGGQTMSLDSLNAISDKLLSYMDPRFGGIAGAPKFPSPNLLSFFWRSYERTQSKKYKNAFLLAISQMSKGGIYDHIGGGFSRYSTDQYWLAPHFEKMLYDNAQLIDLLTLAWKETQDPLYLLRVEETIRWIERDMKLPEGGFASSLDADSEGHEGLYYVWYEAEIDGLLGNDVEYFKKAYDVSAIGNWEGKNILNLSNFNENFADERLARCRQILLEERYRRAPPHKDDKVLADWNGLMIHGLVQASLTFDKPEWLHLARNAFSFIVENMIANGSIYHSWRAGKINPVSFLSDYASLSRAALSLYQATFNEEYLRYAEEWTHTINEKYKAEDGGYNFLQKDVNEISSSLKEMSDDPIPSGNSLALEIMVKLKVLTESNSYDQDIENQIHYFSSLMKGQPMMLATMLNAYELYHRYITVSLRGHAGDTRIFDFLKIAAKIPSLCVIFKREIVNEDPNVVLCKNFTCGDPIVTPEELDEKLRKMISE